MNQSPRILILTAAFGEGHNSAAQNLALALTHLGIENTVADPCLLSAPRITAILQWGYRLVTTHLPRIWGKIYFAADHFDFSRPRLPLTHPPETYLRTLLTTYQPHAIVSTFPLYPYFLARHFQKTGEKIPTFTIVTDSIEINTSWLRGPTDHFLVTDQPTLASIHTKGIPTQKITTTGFPVHPTFATLPPLPATAPTTPFRILYFPTAQTSLILPHSRAILDTSPHIHLTIVLGKNLRRLHSRARLLRTSYPGRVHILGWTRKIPTLLTTHHLAIGKAGGATVHEAIAAHTPMLIHHLVPGQEEGNLKLLLHLGAGHLAETPAALTTALTHILADNASAWRKMKIALQNHNTSHGAQNTANFILNHI